MFHIINEVCGYQPVLNIIMYFLHKVNLYKGDNVLLSSSLTSRFMLAVAAHHGHWNVQSS
jgi:hypothetical protein